MTWIDIAIGTFIFCCASLPCLLFYAIHTRNRERERDNAIRRQAWADAAADEPDEFDAFIARLLAEVHNADENAHPIHRPAQPWRDS